MGILNKLINRLKAIFLFDVRLKHTKFISIGNNITCKIYKFKRCLLVLFSIVTLFLLFPLVILGFSAIFLSYCEYKSNYKAFEKICMIRNNIIEKYINITGLYGNDNYLKSTLTEDLERIYKSSGDLRKLKIIIDIKNPITKDNNAKLSEIIDSALDIKKDTIKKKLTLKKLNIKLVTNKNSFKFKLLSADFIETIGDKYFKEKNYKNAEKYYESALIKFKKEQSYYTVCSINKLLTINARLNINQKELFYRNILNEYFYKSEFLNKKNIESYCKYRLYKY